MAQSPGAVEYTEFISAKKQDFSNEFHEYDTKQSEAPVILKLWAMHSTRLLPSFASPHWFGVVATYRVLSMGQIEEKCELI